MKRALLILLLCGVASHIVAQKVGGTFTDRPLAEVLDALVAQQTKYTVSYVHNQLEGIRVTTNVKEVALPQAIKEVCREYPLKVKQRGNVILVQSKLPFGVMLDRGKQLSSPQLRELLSANFSEMTDSMQPIALQEVTIEADRIVHRGDHDVLYLSKENRAFGSNALDAISSLILFQTSLNDTKLLSWDRQEVFILINGVPSTAIDLRGYKGDDIKHIEYYAVAPPQYMGFTMGSVVNVIVKKRHDRQYSGYVNTSNAVNTGFGTNQIDLTYADSLNQVKLGYFIDYRNIKDISSQTDFTYSPTHRSQYRGSGYNGGEYHNLYTSYQRYQGNHLFNAKLYSVIDPGREEDSRSSTIVRGNETTQGHNFNQLKSQSQTATLDLYYRYQMKQGRMFAINVVNSLGESQSESTYMTNPLGESTDEVGSYDYQTELANNSYSFITNAMYIAPLWGGQFNTAVRYEYKQLYQQSAASEYTPYSHYEFVYAGGSWRWKQGWIVPTIGVNLLQQASTSSIHTSVLPYFRLYTDWWGEGTMKGASVQLTLTSNQRNPSLGGLTESVTYLDPWTVSIGNPELRPYWMNTAKLALCYFAPDGKNMINLVATPYYAHNKIATTIVRDGGKVYFQPRNIGREFGGQVLLAGTWSPLKWLSFSPYWEYYFSNFQTPSQHVRFNYMRIGGGVTFYRNNMSLLLAINSPTKEYDGDLLIRGSLQYAAVFQYKWKDWSFGAQYNYLGHNDYTIAELPDFRYYKNKDWRPLHHLTRITATYTFSVGRARRHDSKLINESSDNTGLGKFNKPQKPQ